LAVAAASAAAFWSASSLSSIAFCSSNYFLR
jgi:hypothetical protein